MSTKKKVETTVENIGPTPVLEVNEKVAKALKALEEFENFDQEKIDFIVAKCSVAALDNHGQLAKLAVDETQRGLFEDKATKNLFACEYVVNHMRHLKTVGIIEEDEVKGLTYIAEPVGVVAGITPVTNPTSTAIFKSLICLKTRNPIIFAFHPHAQNLHSAKVVYEAAIAQESKLYQLTTNMDKTSALMKHPDTATILATGGNSMVEAATLG